MNKNDFEKYPPMGWNSWDCYGAAVTEKELRQNADYMAEHLKEHGWEYVVRDIPVSYTHLSYERQCFQECSYIFPSLFVVLFFTDPVWDG